MSACGNYIRHLCLRAALCAPLLFAPSLQAADAAAGVGYEGWAFSTTETSLAREPLDSRAWQGNAGGYETVSATPAPLGLQLTRTLDNGLALDAGLSHGQMLDRQPPPGRSRADYHDAFLGVRYQGFSGQVWYLDEPRAEGGSQQQSLYYQAGWTAPVSERMSVSLQMGQSYRRGAGFEHDYPDLSIAAEGDFGGYGLGVRLIDRSGLGYGEQDAGYSLIGSFSKPFP
ncbi:TorF family putative porin [Thiohalobacter thiocyanaticus]|uniref:Cellulose biosynthesis protein BcsS n=1 Tax=Thiohalobacter thiocyanaticus TaxID=585455 RepID=A0A426QE22_9GAMM|nr:hypothetical protein [Thiohalobacter thiocyanaticus]RRQ19964.1 hypothetical protein D6C00_14480 [Thiohalobacter thiocyanaticus]